MAYGYATATRVFSQCSCFLSRNKQFIKQINNKGWGGEDGDFYDRVKEKRKIVRYREKGLIHLWHPKSCLPNVTVFTDRQLQACKASRQGEAGSELGRKMLEKWFVQHPEAIYDGN